MNPAIDLDDKIRDLLDQLDQATPGPPAFAELHHYGRRAPSRVVPLIAAAAVVAIGVGGLVAVNARNDKAVIQPAAPPAASQPAPSMGPASTAIDVGGTIPPAPAGATPLAKGDVRISEPGSGFSGLKGQTLRIDAEQKNGEATGEFRVGGVTVTIQCAGTSEFWDDLILAGIVTANAHGSARLDDATVAVGDLLALIIRQKPEHLRQRVTLYQPSLGYGEATEQVGSCNELVDSLPENLDGGFFDYVKVGAEIDTQSNKD